MSPPGRSRVDSPNARRADASPAVVAATPASVFTLDGADVPFTAGQTVIQAALAAGRYVPHLCYHPEFKPHGSCKVCTLKVDGHWVTSCTLPAQAGMRVESDTDEINDKRRMLVQMLFVEGNHFCPSCEKSGDCVLQAIAYDLGMLSAQFDHFFPNRPVDASHPDLLLDFNRCILCELCVRASSEVDGKGVFALSGRGMTKHLIVNSESGRLADTNIAATDKAVDVCPVGVILKKEGAFGVPIGQRRFDVVPISAQALRDAPRVSERAPAKDR
jgi:[NiFe] hydrogenase diaphorase moiety small subunit